MEEQQQDQNPHLVGHHRHRGRKEHHHRVRGHCGHCGCGHQGHKHHGRHRKGHGHRPRHGHGHRHGHKDRHGQGQEFVDMQEQIEQEGQMIVAHAKGVELPQPPESSEGDIHHHHRRRHCHRHRHGRHPYHLDCRQVTETGTTNELSGVMVRMSLEDEPKE